jgi:pyruvate dehydrogenase E2 component (dihydrolipoamide acetyltransferase)
MATKVLMEALSPTMEEGRLVEWKKKEGDTVAAGDVLAEVETDKAVMDLVARVGGTLLKQVIAAGTTVPVSALVGVIGKAGEDVSGLMEGQRGGGAEGQKPARSAPTPVVAATAPAPAAVAGTPAALAPTASTVSSVSSVSSDRLKASPLARKVATDRGIDLRAIQGSGPEGRIVLRDLATAAPIAAAASSTPLPFRPSGAAYTDVPLTQIRKTIAKRLAASLGPVPTFYLTAEIDMERAWEAREALKALGPEGKISFNDIVVKGVALALRQHLGCNAWWQDDRIRYWNEVHVSMAVAVEDGLITPVIRHADLKSLRQISAESKDLAARARERKLKPEEYSGGTFSVSNLGMFDIDQFTAIINPPEAGILAIGAIVEKPVVVDGAVAVRRRMRVTLSCDHRVIDGATGAAFLKTLKTLLENPLAMVW